MSSTLLAKQTPFTAHDIDLIEQEEHNSTSFDNFIEKGSWYWVLSQLSISPRIVLRSAWAVWITPRTQSCSVTEDDFCKSIYATVTQQHTSQSNSSSNSKMAARAIDVEPIDDDRRIYALAAVQRVQRLLELSQEEIADLIRVSRPTLWHWEKGRTPQVRSLRRLYEVANALDLIVDAMGGEDAFSPAKAQLRLDLACPLIEALQDGDGPKTVLDRLFAPARASAPRPTFIPSIEELLAEAELSLAEDDVSSEEKPTSTVRRTSAVRRLRKVTRRSR